MTQERAEALAIYLDSIGAISGADLIRTLAVGLPVEMAMASEVLPVETPEGVLARLWGR